MKDVKASLLSEAAGEENLRFLLVEGSEVLAAAIREAMEAGGVEVEWVLAADLGEARAELAQSVPDIALIDMHLADGQGTDLLPPPGQEACCPFVILSRSPDRRVAMEAMKTGALDCVPISDTTLAEMPFIVGKALLQWRHIIERRQAQEALVAADKRLREEIAHRQRAESERDRLFEGARDMFGISEISGTLKQVNPAWTKTLGWSEEVLLGRPFMEFVHPADREAAFAAVEQLKTEGKLNDFGNRYRCRDGSYKWLSWNAFSLPDEGLTYAVGRDVTESKSAEDALRESEHRLGKLLDNLPGVVISAWDEDGNVIWVNKEMKELTGYIQMPTDFRDIMRALHPDPLDRDRFMKKIKEMGGNYRGLEMEMTCGDGTKKTLSYSNISDTVPIPGFAKWVIGIDVTERKRMEEELHVAHRQMQNIIEFLPDATFVIDGDKKVVAWNKAVEEMTGVGKEKMIGRGDYAYSEPFYGKRRPILIDLVDSPQLEKEVTYDLVGKRGETMSVEQYLPALSGGEGRHVWATASRLCDEEGNFVGAIESVRDITDRKEAERELQEAYRELDAFVYTVSHDLRSPLTPIIGYADVIGMNYADRLDAEALGFLDKITEQAHRMKDLMEDLLSLAKAGHLQRPALPVDVDEVVQRVLEERGKLITDADVAVKTGRLSPVHVHKCLLFQVFDNLIGNAILYAAREGTPIEVGEERSENRVRYYVRDHGPGIPPEERNRIFEVFYRGSTGNEVEGTGIGLAAVRKIAGLHGGRAWVEETPGGGSTFWLEIESV